MSLTSTNRRPSWLLINKDTANDIIIVIRVIVYTIIINIIIIEIIIINWLRISIHIHLIINEITKIFTILILTKRLPYLLSPLERVFRAIHKTKISLLIIPRWSHLLQLASQLYNLYLNIFYHRTLKRFFHEKKPLHSLLHEHILFSGLFQYWLFNEI